MKTLFISRSIIFAITSLTPSSTKSPTTSGANGVNSNERNARMNLLKCKNGCILMHDTTTDAYWLVTQICGKPTRLFAGGSRDKADRTFNHYAKREG